MEQVEVDVVAESSKNGHTHPSRLGDPPGEPAVPRGGGGEGQGQRGEEGELR